MSTKKYQNPVGAALAGALELFKKKVKYGELKDSDRIDGKTVLITGSNSGLGFATAVDLAKRGGHIIMACRSGIPTAGEEVKRLSGSQKVEMMKVDLSDMDSINAFIEELKNKGVKIDILIMNAGIVPAQSRKTKQGLEEMFMVNYFSAFVVVKKIIEGSFMNTIAADKPKIIFTASESHRSGPDIDWNTFGKYQEYTMGKSVALYGYYKLLLVTFAQELNRRLNKNGLTISVFSLCPGAVNSNIAKEAPEFLKPVIKVLFGLFFNSPFNADEPLLYFACSKDMKDQTGMYLHLMSMKDVDERATDVITGEMLWQRSEELLTSLGG
jgi:NAD(P)-dependent dehydrogenase (short-subunit alcohol dehydrogenase family)